MGTSSVHLYHIILGLMEITEALCLDAFDAGDFVSHAKLEEQFCGYDKLFNWLTENL